MKTKVLLIAALLSTGAWGQENGVGKARISIPGVTGVLELDVGPAAWQSTVRPDGREVRLQAMDRRDHLVISAFLQKVAFPASPDKCFSAWWPGSEKAYRDRNLSLQQVAKSKINGIPRVEYLVPEFQGVSVRQKNLHAYLGAGDLCAEIHLSKISFSAEDQKLFEALIATVRLLPGETAASNGIEIVGQSPQPSTLHPQGSEKSDQSSVHEYFAEGTRLYLQRNYGPAAERYQKALDLEKEKRTLSQTYFRLLVDNLGTAYGISGDLDKAAETFAYGIAEDPEFPSFHYNLACVYGEAGDKHHALDELELAYKYKANLIPGETFPDPLHDDSFRKFSNDSDFVQAVHALQKQ
jgi:tetratricopeptide (TPR) repeat protein